MSGTAAVKMNNFNPHTDPWEERRLDTCAQVMTTDGALDGARGAGAPTGTLRTTPTVDVSQGWHGDEWAGAQMKGAAGGRAG